MPVNIPQEVYICTVVEDFFAPETIMFDERYLKEAMGPESAWMRSGEEAGGNLDAAVLRSLLMLTSGDLREFSHYKLPPAKIQSWVEEANSRQVHGALILVLRRWHEIRRESTEKGTEV